MRSAQSPARPSNRQPSFQFLPRLHRFAISPFAQRGRGIDGPRLLLQAVGDEFVERAIEAITAAARTGKVGDGKIFVTDLEQALRIRTGEVGDNAL